MVPQERCIHCAVVDWNVRVDLPPKEFGAEPLELLVLSGETISE